MLWRLPIKNINALDSVSTTTYLSVGRTSNTDLVETIDWTLLHSKKNKEELKC